MSIITSRKLVYFILYYNLFCGFAIKNLGVNRSCLFLIDVLYIIILFKDNFKIKSAGLLLPTIILMALFFVLLVGAVLNNVEPGNFIWGLRNQYLSLAIFFASASFLSLKDINKLFKFFFYFQFLNLACALYQYFVLGYYMDTNNGAFINGNGQDIFCGILITWYLYQYANRKCKLWHFMFVLLSSLLIAAIEEEKFIFIETVLIFLYYFITDKKISLKKVFTAFVFVGILSIAAIVLTNINGESSLKVLTNQEAFMSYQENAFELPRIGSSAIISKMFFVNDWQNLFGLGLGMCEESSTLSFINADFYNKYEWLHYSWFTFHINFLQTGWIGVILLLLFFLSILYMNCRNRRNCPPQFKFYYDISIIITFLCFITIWYNGTLRSYNSIIPLFVLSIGCIITKQISCNNRK